MSPPTATSEPSSGPQPQVLAPRGRLLAAGSAFGLLYMAGPGILDADGSSVLAILALALWGRMASRPGPWAVAIEFLCAAVAWAGILSWAGFVWPGLLLWLGPGMAVYMVVQGLLLRRVTPRLPLALALPAVWIFSEGVRAVMVHPFGFEWMRLGTHLHHVEWLAGSARVWGIGGLSWILAALAGFAADLIVWFLDGRRPARSSLVLGLGPAALAALLTVLVPVPPSRPGPRILLVQPAFEQQRKMEGLDPYDLFHESVQLTARGLREIAAEGLEPPDLIAWGESMLPVVVIEPGLADAVAAGLHPDPWVFANGVTEEQVRLLDLTQRNWVDVGIFGSSDRSAPSMLGQHTSFVTGAERLIGRDGRLRRQAAVLLWSGPGTPDQVAVKRHLVPGAETMLGLERFEVVRDTIFELAGYVPDLIPATVEPRALTLRTPAAEYRFGVSVCYDNAFDDAFTGPFSEGQVDFHLVVSNEAWFRQSQEADQMIAFSRLGALSTGRAVCRAANSGISCVLGPDGREIARLVVGDRDREVRGTLHAQVPVPVDPAARTLFVRLEWLWIALWILGPGALLVAFGRSRRYPPPTPGKSPG